MTVNRKMFRELDEIIMEFPELHHQASWQSSPEQNGTCGTTRCIAGWAVWLKAKELGLVSRKRDDIDRDLLVQVAQHLGINRAEYQRQDELYGEAGALILGLDGWEADSLFHDYSTVRVPVRVKSYAETGHDITELEYSEY